MFHCLDLRSQLDSREKEKKKKELIVLHSLLIPLNFALSEKRELNTLWIFVFQKQKKKEKIKDKRKNSRFASASSDYKKENSILDSVCSLSF